MIRFVNRLKRSLVVVLVLASGCGFVEEQAGVPPHMGEGDGATSGPRLPGLSSHTQDAQSYAQGAQDAAMCALEHAPNSAPARLAGAKSREAQEAQAAAANASADLAAKRAKSDKALSEAKAAREAARRAHANSMAIIPRLHRAREANEKVVRNNLTGEHLRTFNRANYIDPDANRHLESIPEYNATARAWNEVDRELRDANAVAIDAEYQAAQAVMRAEDAQADFAAANQAAQAASDRAYTAMVESRQHALNASPKCSHVAGIQQPEKPRSMGEEIIRSLIPGISIGIGGFGGGRSGGGGGEGHK